MDWSLCHDKPSEFLKDLVEDNLTEDYPELKNLMTCRQNPIYHKEDTVWNHTLMVVDRAAEIAIRQKLASDTRMTLLFGALLHDVAKPLTTVGEYPDLRSPGHAERGPEIAEVFLNRIGVSDWLKDRVYPLIRYHMHYLNPPNIKSVNRLKKNLKPSSIDELLWLIEADVFGRVSSTPIIFPANAIRIRELSEVEYIEVVPRPKSLITGDHLIQLGLKPSPEYRTILEVAYAAESNGEFNNVEEGKVWLSKYLAEKII
jgi:tRNA nucleotidyltransferase (CCA-adding enzyme)